MRARILAVASVGVLTVGLVAVSAAPNAALTVTAVNKLDFPRPSQTLELSAQDLAPLGEKDLRKIHVKDGAGKELVCQAVDGNGDYAPDAVVFQADFAPRETKTFVVSAGGRWIYKKEDFKAYGRFNRERFDDFVWENDRVAHRMYGKALETWVQEPLTSSTVDVWLKRAPRLVVNDWYMVDNYHADTGEGADFYSAGPSRGVGGNGLWANDRLWVSKNFVASRVLAQGPIRVMFELTYEPFDVAGTSVSEVKRITLDAGQQVNRFQSFYQAAGAKALLTGIGLKKTDLASREQSAERGLITGWEPVRKGASGNMGTVVIVDPKRVERMSEDRLNLLVLARVSDDLVATYWAGSCWDKAGPCADVAAWQTYAARAAQEFASPIELRFAAQ